MSRQSSALALLLAAAAALAPASVRAGIITQTASLPLTSTNFRSGSGQVAPLVLQQFDTQNNTRTLDSVDLSFHAAITNQYGMRFTTPATITVSVATGKTDTPGPTITLFQPDGVHPLLTVKAPNDPTFLTRSVTYGSQPGQKLPQTFGSGLPSTSPYYLAPSMVQASNRLNLTSAPDLALFTGNGTLRLPVSASAFSSFSTTSGNGMGRVTTQGTADVSVSYNWHLRQPSPQLVPEPAAFVLWGIGGALLVVAGRARRRA